MRAEKEVGDDQCEREAFKQWNKIKKQIMTRMKDLGYVWFQQEDITLGLYSGENGIFTFLCYLDPIDRTKMIKHPETAQMIIHMLREISGIIPSEVKLLSNTKIFFSCKLNGNKQEAGWLSAFK